MIRNSMKEKKETLRKGTSQRQNVPERRKLEREFVFTRSFHVSIFDCSPNKTTKTDDATKNQEHSYNKKQLMK